MGLELAYAHQRISHHYRPEHTMTVKTLEDLFIHDLSDIYSAEKAAGKA